MNYLAHAYLSFNNPEVLVGNMVADDIRGKQIDNIPSEIHKGIQIHRLIDKYTDEHPIVRETKIVFREIANRYDGIFLDIAYDYFLANDLRREPDTGWNVFSEWCYRQVDSYIPMLPGGFTRMFKYMKDEDWLCNYRNKWMIERSFGWLAKRALFLPDDINVYSVFLAEYETLQESYNLFFPDLEKYAKEISL